MELAKCLSAIIGQVPLVILGHLVNEHFNKSVGAGACSTNLTGHHLKNAAAIFFAADVTWVNDKSVVTAQQPPCNSQLGLWQIQWEQ